MKNYDWKYLSLIVTEIIDRANTLLDYKNTYFPDGKEVEEKDLWHYRDWAWCNKGSSHREGTLLIDNSRPAGEEKDSSQESNIEIFPPFATYYYYSNYWENVNGVYTLKQGFKLTTEDFATSHTYPFGYYGCWRYYSKKQNGENYQLYTQNGAAGVMDKNVACGDLIYSDDNNYEVVAADIQVKKVLVQQDIRLYEVKTIPEDFSNVNYYLY